MKKIILGSLIAASLLTTSAFAKDGGTDVHIGYNHVDLLNANGNGANVGMNYVVPLKILGNGDDSGLEVGFGMDIGGGSLSASDSTGSSTGFMNGDAQVFGGYQYANAHVRGGIGYGFLRFGNAGDSAMTGAEYTASAGYDFTEKYGFDVTYKSSSMSPAVGADVNVDYIGVNFIIHR